MKEYLVTFEIITNDYSLQDLEKLLDLNADNNSHSIGDIRGFGGEGRIFNSTVLKMRSGIQKTANIVEHLNSIRSIVSEKILDIKKIPANCSVLLNIGILYNTLTCSIEIPPYYWKWMDENNISMEITCYPCCDSDEDDSDEPDD